MKVSGARPLRLLGKISDPISGAPREVQDTVKGTQESGVYGAMRRAFVFLTRSHKERDHRTKTVALRVDV